MPELPEVQTVANQLSGEIVGKNIVKIVNYRDNLRNNFDLNEIDNFSQAKIEKVERVAKYILIYCSNGKVLLIHLGMTGRFVINKLQNLNFQQCDKHNHYDIILSDEFENFWQVSYIDSRRFGLFEIVNESDLKLRLGDVGIDPFDDFFTIENFKKLVSKSNSKAKNFLMSQKYISGIGNIYACEILFKAKINPNFIIKKLNSDQIAMLYNAILNILNEAISHGGSSISNYVDVHNISGKFQNQHMVYGREGADCFVCGEKISKQTDQSRSTFFCPNCQLI